MQHRLEDTMSTKRRPLVHFLGTIWARSLGNVLGTTIKIIFCHKMSSNLYIFMLQSFKYLTEYLEVELSHVEDFKIADNETPGEKKTVLSKFK